MGFRHDIQRKAAKNPAEIAYTQKKSSRSVKLGSRPRDTCDNHDHDANKCKQFCLIYRDVPGIVRRTISEKNNPGAEQKRTIRETEEYQKRTILAASLHWYLFCKQ